MDDDEKFGLKISGLKYCRKCKIKKNRDTDFYKNERSWDGRHGICKDCHYVVMEDCRVRRLKKAKRTKWDLD